MNNLTHRNYLIKEIISCRPKKVYQVNQNLCTRKMIGTWIVRIMLQTGILENVKIEIKLLKIDILGICEMKWNR